MSEDDAPRRRLPDVALPRADGGAGGPVPLRAPRQGTVLVLLDAAPDARDAAFLDALAAHKPALRAWDGRVLLVVGDAAPALAAAFPVLLDPSASIATAAGVVAPALLVTDQWGEVYFGRVRDAGEGWPDVVELEQWLRFLAIRCAG